MRTTINFLTALMMVLTLVNCKKDKTSSPEPEPTPVLPTTGNLNLAAKDNVNIASAIDTYHKEERSNSKSFTITTAKVFTLSKTLNLLT